MNDSEDYINIISNFSLEKEVLEGKNVQCTETSVYTSQSISEGNQSVLLQLYVSLLTKNVVKFLCLSFWQEDIVLTCAND